MSYNYRFHKNELPEINQLVMIRIESIDDYAVQVSLLEYNDIKGMIYPSDLSKKRVRSIKQFARLNNVEVAEVIRIDKEKGYIDLSKKSVSGENIKFMEEKYSKLKIIHEIAKKTSRIKEISIEDVYENLIWKLYDEYDDAYEAFQLSLKDENIIEDEVLRNLVKERFFDKDICVKTKFRLTCFGKEGIDTIKEILIKVKKEKNVNIISENIPFYILKVECDEREKAEKITKECLNMIKEESKKYDLCDFSLDEKEEIQLEEDEFVFDSEEIE